MIGLRPLLHDLVGSAASRTIAQLEGMGVKPTDRQVRVGVHLPAAADPARQLVTETMVDMLLRLDPLVGEVIIDMPGRAVDEWRSDLATKLPFDGRQVHEVAVVSGRTAVFTVALVGCRHLVSDVVDQRVSPVAPLGHLGYDATGERRHVLRLAGHPQVRPHQVDVKRHPRRDADAGVHGQPDGAVADCRPAADVEGEPVPDVACRRPAEFVLGHLPCHLPVKVDVQAAPSPEVTGEERLAPFTIHPSSMRYRRSISRS